MLRIVDRTSMRSALALAMCLGIALSLVAPEKAHGDPLFADPVLFDVGNNPYHVATGDVSGDGVADVLTANADANTISVLLGHSDGSFSTKMDYETGLLPLCLAIADLSGDGRPDLAVANFSDNTVSVLLGNGDGTFLPRLDYGTGLSPRFVAISDVNGDGKPDLVVANSNNNLEPNFDTVSILIGHGDGTFAAKVDYATGPNPQALAIGDLNNDGKRDLAVANNNGSSVSVLLGNGDGTFGTKVDYTTSDFPTSVAIGDLNADGRLDLAVATAADQVVSVLLGQGDGTFTGKVDYGTGGVALSVAIGDLDADGKLDLAVACAISHAVAVLLGHGDGTFMEKANYVTGGGPHSVAIGEFSGDGRPDLAVANSFQNQVSILRNIGSPPVTLAVNVDLDPDVIQLASRAPWLVAHLEPIGFEAADIDLPTVVMEGSVFAASKFAVIGDFNANGIPELMVKFRRDALDPLLTLGSNSLEITGTLKTGEHFSGTGDVRVLDRGGAPKASVTPNPLHRSGVLAFTTSRPGRVRVAIFDARGSLVRLLMDTTLPEGSHTARFDGRGREGRFLSSGIYFYRVETTGGSVQGRIVVMR
jgi:hypothetical protein